MSPFEIDEQGEENLKRYIKKTTRAAAVTNTILKSMLMYNDNGERMKEMTFYFYSICEPENTNGKRTVDRLFRDRSYI
jgi:hypothetical protein